MSTDMVLIKAVAVASVPALLLGAIWLRSSSAGEAPVGQATAAPAADPLLARLTELHRTWNPKTRADLLAGWSNQREALAAPLVAWLGRPDAPYLPQALELAVGLDVKEARSAILAVAAAGRLEEAAVRTADALAPLDVEEIKGLLTDPRASLVIATLAGLPADRFHDCMPSVIALLEHADPAVRAAAARALPHNPPQGAVHLLLGNGQASAATAASLIRLGTDEGMEQVMGLLDSRQRSQRVAALAALVAEAKTLPTPEPVYRILEIPERDLRERALALYCLERTGAANPSELKRHLPGMSPVLSVFVARSLIAAGDQSGIGVLVEILEQETELAGVEPALAEGVRAEARALLARLSGFPATTQVAEWREWWDALPHNSLQPRRLEPTTIHL